MDTHPFVVHDVIESGTRMDGRHGHVVATPVELVPEHPDVLLHAAHEGRVQVGEEEDTHQRRATSR